MGLQSQGQRHSGGDDGDADAQYAGEDYADDDYGTDYAKRAAERR